MDAFFEYTRNISYYLLFMVAVGLLAPSGSYKKYITLVMGIMMIGIVVAPIVRIGDMVIGREQVPVTNLFAGITAVEIPHQNDYLRDMFYSQLTGQAKALLADNGFGLVSAEWEAAEDLSYIHSAWLTVKVLEAEPERLPFIRIEPVRVAPYQPLPPSEESEEPEETQTIKNLISDFYNMYNSNIHIKIQRG